MGVTAPNPPRAGNRIVDCGTGRAGWSAQVAVAIEGSRDVTIQNNMFRNTIGDQRRRWPGHGRWTPRDQRQ